MDPFSVTATILGLVASCLQIADTINRITSGAETAHFAIQGLRSETQILARILSSISASLQDHENGELIGRTTAGGGAGGEAQYWNIVATILKDCEETLKRLKRILDQVEVSKRSKMFKEFGKYLKLSSKEVEFTFLRREIQSYKSSLQLPLEMIAICKLIDKDAWNADTTVRLDEISRNVHSIYREIKHIEDTLPDMNAEHVLVDATTGDTLQGSNPDEKEGNNSTIGYRSRNILKNLQEHARCASVIIATASTISESRGAWSHIGDDYFIKESTEKVQGWLPQWPGIHEETNKADDGCDDSGSDIDLHFETNILKAGSRYFEREEYVLAESFLRKGLEQKLKAPTTSASGAEDDTIKSLELKQMLAQACAQQGKHDEALEILAGLVEDLKLDRTAKPGPLYYDIVHQIAVLHHDTGDLERAQHYAEEASRGRKRLFGKRHVDFLRSIELLSTICEASGDLHRAIHYKSYLDEQGRGFLPLAEPTIKPSIARPPRPTRTRRRTEKSGRTTDPAASYEGFSQGGVTQGGSISSFADQPSQAASNPSSGDRMNSSLSPKSPQEDPEYISSQTKADPLEASHTSVEDLTPRAQRTINEDIEEITRNENRHHEAPEFGSSAGDILAIIRLACDLRRFFAIVQRVTPARYTRYRQIDTEIYALLSASEDFLHVVKNFDHTLQRWEPSFLPADAAGKMKTILFGCNVTLLELKKDTDQYSAIVPRTNGGGVKSSIGTSYGSNLRLGPKRHVRNRHQAWLPPNYQELQPLLSNLTSYTKDLNLLVATIKG